MSNSEDAYWILEILNTLRSPDAGLVRDLLEHMARLRTAQSAAARQTEAPGSWVERLAHDQKPVPINLQEPEQPAMQQRELQRRHRTEAIHARLREGWQRVKELPPCVEQCRILRETSYFCIYSVLIEDPLSEQPAKLTLERARKYGLRSLELAEMLGDGTEIAESCIILATHCKLATDYDGARTYCRQAMRLAERIGSAYLQWQSLVVEDEVLTLIDAGLTERIENCGRLISAGERLGDLSVLITHRGELAKLLILDGNLEQGGAELEKLASLVDALNGLTAKERALIAHHHQGVLGLLRYSCGHPGNAIECFQKAVRLNATNPEPIQEYLWNDLAWLEKLCLQERRSAEFAAFCREIRPNSRVQLTQWHLERATPPPAVWAQVDALPGRDWRWRDPLGKSRFAVDGEWLGIEPIMGTGVYSNVYLPRLVKDANGDFAIETVLDYGENATRAGGVLVYQDDSALVRLGVGLHFDGEVTLTVKSPRGGFCIAARGMLAARQVRLRMERRNDRFSAWCGDGECWFGCGEIQMEMDKCVEVGLFAECTYRLFAPIRCTAALVSYGRTSWGIPT